MSIIEQQNVLRDGAHGKGNYKKEIINEVVQAVEGGSTQKEISRQYGIAQTTVSAWMLRYGSAAYWQRNKPFTEIFKRRVVEAVQTGSMRIREARVAFQVTEDTIRRWRRELSREIADLAASIPTMSKERPEKTPGQNPAPTDVKALQQALEEAQLKIIALNRLIDVAEEQLKINIRKKPGAKQ
jgi:transposase